jgi:ribosome biogenesis protein ENP2
LIRAPASGSQYQQNSRASSKRALPDVRLVPLQAHGPEGQNVKDKDATFGQRRRVVSNSTRASTSTPDRVSRTADGVTEMSWIPSSKRKSNTAMGEAKDAKKRNQGIESFGLGMERGDHPVPSIPMSGRTQRRKGMRSGSKNAFRKI